MRLKITEKVTFHIIESEVQFKKQKSILTSFGKPKACDLQELPDRSKIGGKYQN